MLVSVYASEGLRGILMLYDITVRKLITVAFALWDLAVPPTTVVVLASPSELTVREGMEATFDCHLEGDARSRLVWSRLPHVSITQRLFIFLHLFVC